MKTDPTVPITNARRIINTRNRISHGYDTVSEDIIWAIVIRELPNLELEVTQLLDKLGGSALNDTMMAVLFCTIAPAARTIASSCASREKIFLE
jgi:hypothetical protein